MNKNHTEIQVNGEDTNGGGYIISVYHKLYDSEDNRFQTDHIAQTLGNL